MIITSGLSGGFPMLQRWHQPVKMKCWNTGGDWVTIPGPKPAQSLQTNYSHSAASFPPTIRTCWVYQALEINCCRHCSLVLPPTLLVGRKCLPCFRGLPAQIPIDTSTGKANSWLLDTAHPDIHNQGWWNLEHCNAHTGKSRLWNMSAEGKLCWLTG